MAVLKSLEDAIPSPTSCVVEFDGPDDRANPMNWPFHKKCYTSLLYSCTSFGSVWASTAYAPANADIAERFDVSPQVALLGTSLLLFGWAFGPLFWGPLSELYGRRLPVLVPSAISMLMALGTATASNIQTVLVTRFFAGFFGSAPITCMGGINVDLWHATQRGNAIVGYMFAVSAALATAPVVGGAVIYCGLNWRWTQYITVIIQGFILALDVILIDESYTPILLVRKARKLRKATGNQDLYAQWEKNPVSLRALAVKFGLRPLQILGTPICLFITIYLSFIYGVYYASLASFPILFRETRGWNTLIASLPFLAVLVGVIGGAVVTWFNQQHYNRELVANNNMPVPEARLPPMKVASLVLASGLFIMGWTSRQDVHWTGTVVGSAMMGYGFYTIFTSSTNYLVDSFQHWASSAVAANTFVRSMFAGILPLLVKPWFHHLGNGWAMTVLGAFAVLNVPIPFIFAIYGPRIRARGKYTSGVV
ncbi:mfs transporter [Ophiostoma piceae UAMH 11346]|uniref:Mfs transporter n=1 Tax=Ophiostoma piceae (strain UAMH 11346) TaxID=1262450 RepID=S3C467_OPHP1|nr:mfs transporter [Ophiostoma piceae UAMH 11346]